MKVTVPKPGTEKVEKLWNRRVYSGMALSENA
jgi:hypothetical protein